MSSFSIAESEGGNAEAHFYGPWNRLLNTMFPVDSKFEVHPQYPPPGLNKESVDFVAVLILILLFLILNLSPSLILTLF